MAVSIVTCEDNMEFMSRYSDKFFELAIVDPPYGIGEDWKKRNKVKKEYSSGYKNDSIPNEAYFKELVRVSQNLVVWGYNYFTEFLPPTNYLICWDKMSNNNDVFQYSQFELAYTTKRSPARLVQVPWDGYRMGKETGCKKIHPHQKPIALYRWVMKNYTNPGDKILDTHMGSQSSRIAAYDMGFDYYGCELDSDYFREGCKRFDQHIKQLNLFQPEQLAI